MRDIRHFPLVAQDWQPDAASSAIDRIVADAAAHLDDARWPAHAQDDFDESATTSLYLGAAGVLWGLDYLRRRGFGGTPPNLAALLPRMLELARAETARGPYPEHGSFLIGEMGATLAAMRLSPEARYADRIYALASANTVLPPVELMWGLAGSMLVCVFMDEMTSEARWGDLFKAQAAHLLDGFQEHETGWVWTQDLYRHRQRYLGTVHGYAGNMLALMRGWRWLDEGQQNLVRTTVPVALATHALRAGDGANWPATLPSDGAGEVCQYCHGAPGIVTTFADAPFESPALDALLNEGGGFIWEKGPLSKGSNLCHGTGGNGYAFLKLYRRTGESIWLERARAFAMQAIAQCDAARTAFGRGRYSLWTGDIGLAIYLRDCIAAEALFPTIDVF